ncbi:MAG: hypothetical protein JO250_13585, partial [Armatimonadetes bacterium]|nr:hypothetical protein [Armatimonadota bacterium]
MSLANNPKIAITEMPDCAGNLRSAAMLEEYKTLRQEILNQQQNSHQITLLGLTIGGAIVSFIGLGRDAAAPSLTKAVLLFAVVLIFYSLVYAQVYRRRKMNRIGRYIEFVIETQIPGLCWETAWCRRNDTDAADAPSVFETLPLLTL